MLQGGPAPAPQSPGANAANEPQGQLLGAGAGASSAERPRGKRLEMRLPLDEKDVSAEGLEDDVDPPPDTEDPDQPEDPEQPEAVDYDGWDGKQAVKHVYENRLSSKEKRLSTRSLAPLIAERTRNLVSVGTARRYTDELRQQLLEDAYQDLTEDELSQTVWDLGHLLSEKTGLSEEMCRRYLTKKAQAAAQGAAAETTGDQHA
jgi:hypothetical protein